MAIYFVSGKITGPASISDQRNHFDMVIKYSLIMSQAAYEGFKREALKKLKEERKQEIFGINIECLNAL